MEAVLNPRVQRANTILRGEICSFTLPRLEPIAIVADDIMAPSIPNEVTLTKDDNGRTFVLARVDFSWEAPDLSYGTILQYQISFDTEIRPTGNEGNFFVPHITTVSVSQNALMIYPHLCFLEHCMHQLTLG